MRKSIMIVTLLSSFASNPAWADDLYKLSSNGLTDGEVLTVSAAADGGHYVSLKNDEQGANQAWGQSEIDDDWYQITAGSLGPTFCLTVVEDEWLGNTGVMQACEAGNLAQAWRDEDAGDDQGRLYNGAMGEGMCLSAVNTGHHMGSITLTECGTGDVSTELWRAVEAGG